MMTRVDAWLAASVLLASVVDASAQNSLNRPGSGARAAGMGNAFIAVSDDGTAASWNPAGLSQLRKPELSVVYNASWRSLFLEGYRARDRSAMFTALRTPGTDTDLEFASAALPFAVGGRAVTVQVGWRRLFQISSGIVGDVQRVPTSPAGRPASLIRFDNRSSGSVDLWSLAGAVRATSRLSVGWSTDFYDGAWQQREIVSEDPGVLGPTDFNSSHSSNAIGGRTLNLGLLLAYPSVRVGAVYHGPLRSGLTVTNSVRSTLSAPLDESFGRNDGLELRFPRSIGLGVAWLPRPLVRLALDVTYDEWTKYVIRATAPGAPDAVISGFDALPPELSATRNTITVNTGVEKLFPVRGRYVPLRLGFTHEPQGERDPWLRANSDHRVLAAGTGLNSNSVKLDIALEYRFGELRKSDNISPVYVAGRAAEYGLPLAPETEGVARIHEWRVKTSLIYRIADTEKIRGALGGIFGR